MPQGHDAEPVAVLEGELRRRCAGKVLILGMGNDLRADDGAGAAVARRLASRVRATVLNAGSALESFLSPILRERPDTVVVVDAVHFDGHPGELRILHAADLAIRHIGTHGMSPGLFMDMLGREGIGNAFMIGIQPLNTRVGGEMSPVVQCAVETLEGALIRVLGKSDGAG